MERVGSDPSNGASTEKKAPRKKLECQVDGCTARLKRAYCKRFYVCSTHARAESVELGGQACRFCGKCSKFHPLEAFEGTRRNCRAGLSSHNASRKELRQRRAAQKKQQEQQQKQQDTPLGSSSSGSSARSCTSGSSGHSSDPSGSGLEQRQTPHSPPATAGQVLQQQPPQRAGSDAACSSGIAASAAVAGTLGSGAVLAQPLLDAIPPPLAAWLAHSLPGETGLAAASTARPPPSPAAAAAAAAAAPAEAATTAPGQQDLWMSLLGLDGQTPWQQDAALDISGAGLTDAPHDAATAEPAAAGTQASNPGCGLAGSPAGSMAVPVISFTQGSTIASSSTLLPSSSVGMPWVQPSIHEQGSSGSAGISSLSWLQGTAADTGLVPGLTAGAGLGPASLAPGLSGPNAVNVELAQQNSWTGSQGSNTEVAALLAALSSQPGAALAPGFSGRSGQAEVSLMSGPSGEGAAAAAAAAAVVPVMPGQHGQHKPAWLQQLRQQLKQQLRYLLQQRCQRRQQQQQQQQQQQVAMPGTISTTAGFAPSTFLGSATPAPMFDANVQLQVQTCQPGQQQQQLLQLQPQQQLQLQLQQEQQQQQHWLSLLQHSAMAQRQVPTTVHYRLQQQQPQYQSSYVQEQRTFSQQLVQAAEQWQQQQQQQQQSLQCSANAQQHFVLPQHIQEVQPWQLAPQQMLQPSLVQQQSAVAQHQLQGDQSWQPQQQQPPSWASSQPYQQPAQLPWLPVQPPPEQHRQAQMQQQQQLLPAQPLLAPPRWAELQQQLLPTQLLQTVLHGVMQHPPAAPPAVMNPGGLMQDVRSAAATGGVAAPGPGYTTSIFTGVMNDMGLTSTAVPASLAPGLTSTTVLASQAPSLTSTAVAASLAPGLTASVGSTSMAGLLGMTSACVPSIRSGPSMGPASLVTCTSAINILNLSCSPSAHQAAAAAAALAGGSGVAAGFSGIFASGHHSPVGAGYQVCDLTAADVEELVKDMATDHHQTDDMQS